VGRRSRWYISDQSEPEDVGSPEVGRPARRAGLGKGQIEGKEIDAIGRTRTGDLRDLKSEGVCTRDGWRVRMVYPTSTASSSHPHCSTIWWTMAPEFQQGLLQRPKYLGIWKCKKISPAPCVLPRSPHMEVEGLPGPSTRIQASLETASTAPTDRKGDCWLQSTSPAAAITASHQLFIYH
jgi:hypothetical protein